MPRISRPPSAHTGRLAALWLKLLVLAPALALGATGQLSAVPLAGPLPHQPAPLTWQPLPHGGLNGSVLAIAVIGSDLYVGGYFTETADGLVQNLNGIAKLSGGNWTVLPHNGLTGYVTALAVSGSDLYVGGGFTGTADGAVPNLNNIAQLSGGSTWQPLANNGLNWDIRGLTMHDGDLYVGGFFDQTADNTVKDLNSVAKYSNGAWLALPHKGLYNFFVLHCCFVDAFAFSGNDMYAGGALWGETGDHAVTNLNGMAKLSGGMWSTAPHGGLSVNVAGHVYSGHVHAMVPIGSDLYVGGGFTGTADGAIQNLDGIAKLSGGVWSALAHNGLTVSGFSGADTLALHGGDLYVGGGYFTETADGQVQNLNHIAKNSGGAWAPLPDNGLNGGVGVLAFNGNDLYAGGFFTGTADGLVENLNNIAVLSLPAIPNYPVFLPLVRR